MAGGKGGGRRERRKGKFSGEGNETQGRLFFSQYFSFFKGYWGNKMTSNGNTGGERVQAERQKWEKIKASGRQPESERAGGRANSGIWPEGLQNNVLPLKLDS